MIPSSACPSLRTDQAVARKERRSPWGQGTSRLQRVIRFARKRRFDRYFPAIYIFVFGESCSAEGRCPDMDEHDIAPAGRSSEGLVAASARRDHRSWPPAGSAGGEDRLGLSRWALQLGVLGGTRPAWPAAAARCQALHPEVHAQRFSKTALHAITGMRSTVRRGRERVTRPCADPGESIEAACNSSSGRRID